MKIKSKKHLLLCLFLLLNSIAFAQWEQLNFKGGRVFDVQKIGQTVFAHTYGGLFKSIDNGGSWQKANNDTILKLLNVPSFTLIHQYPRLFTYNENLYLKYNNILLKSIDNGNSWNKYSFSSSINSIEYFHIMDTLYAYTGNVDQNVYKLVGNNWVLQSNNLDYQMFFQFDNLSFYNYNQNSPNQGLFVTTNGINFTKISLNGIPKNDSIFTANGFHYLYDITKFAGNSTRIYAVVNDSTLYSSLSNGKWNRINLGLPTNITKIFDIKFVGNSLCINYSTISNANNFIKSDNFGQTWGPMNFNPFEPNVRLGDQIIRGSFNGIYKSGDNGVSWINSSEGLVSTDIRFIKSFKNELFSFDYGLNRYRRSRNNGLTWEIPNGLDTTIFLEPADINISDSLSFFKHYNGIYKSVDAGNTWANVAFPSYMYMVGWVRKFDDNSIYISATDSSNINHYYKTLNFVNYIEVDSIFPVLDQPIVGMKSFNGELYAWSDIIPTMYRSTDNGLSWNIDMVDLPTNERLKYSDLYSIDGKLILSVYDAYNIMLPRIYIREVNKWVRKSCIGIPNGMKIIDIKHHDRKLYAAKNRSNSVYYSNNYGESWILIDTVGFFNGPKINDNALAITNDGVFIGTLNNGMWKYSNTLLGINSTISETASLNIFPNPSSEFIDFLSDRKIEYYNILDISGKIVMHGKYDSQKISIKNLPSGIYIVKLLLNNNQFKTEKFVKY